MSRSSEAQNRNITCLHLKSVDHHNVVEFLSWAPKYESTALKKMVRPTMVRESDFRNSAIFNHIGLLRSD